MNEEEPKLDKLIGHKPLGRILKRDGITAEFALVRRAFEADGKEVPDANKFRRVGEASGTHLLKLITPRAEIGQHLFKVRPAAANEAKALAPSTDAKLAPVAKVVFRPLEVEGHAPRSLVDHIINPDDLSPAVTEAFAEVFGEDSLAELRKSLTSPLPEITTLPAAEFPIIFLPRPGGGDLQVTPIAPAESYIQYRDVTDPYFRKQEDGGAPIPRGRWHHQVVTTKQQNISSAVGQRRTRFLATMPRVLDRYNADLHRYAHGGRFLRWRDKSVAEAVAGYAALLDRSEDYSNADIRSALDDRADRLIDAAKAFVDEALGDVEREYPDQKHLKKPNLIEVILNRRWPKDGFNTARRVLSSDHFKGRLKVAQEL